MTAVDLAPAARTMTDLIAGIPDDRLGDPTPCPEYTLGDLAEHVGGLAMAFTAAAEKSDIYAGRDQTPSGDASRLEDGWRDRIARDLAALAVAWRKPDAWQGMTQAGGVDLPGEVAGIVALDELLIHGWDVARAIGQDYQPDDSSLRAVHGFLVGLAQPGNEGVRGATFGPVVAVPDDAPMLDRAVALAGRKPGWSQS
jgi:uncharacterized protein (TIGR03086 family)